MRALALIALIGCNKSRVEHVSSDAPRIVVSFAADRPAVADLEQVAMTIERKLAGMPHVEHLRTAITRTGGSVVVELDRSADLDEANAAIGLRMNAARSTLPAEVVVTTQQ